MSKHTDHFAVPVIHALRNEALYRLNYLLAVDVSLGASPEAVAAVAKLSADERTALRATLARIIDGSIAQFLYALDDAANTQGGLAVTHGGKPLTTGGYEFGERFPSWVAQAAHHDSNGEPNDKALK